jgi:uncharacterized membrane protein YcaP (DUF421 family)
MESIVRGLVIYLFLFVVFRVAGKRTLAKTSSFDLVLLLIISETVQQAMVVNDHSLTNAALLVLTLVGVDIALSVVKQRFTRAEPWIDGVPLIIVENGKPLKERMDQERVDESDVLEAAREHLGLEEFDQIKYAVLERSGKITVIPRQTAT